MATLSNSKYYADRLTDYVTKKKREKENLNNKQEKFSKAFDSLNDIISKVVLESGLNDFIKLEEKTAAIEFSNSTYQNTKKDLIEIKYTEATCEGISLVFFDKHMSVNDNRNDEYLTRFTIRPTQGFGTPQFLNNIQEKPDNYKPQLNEQHTLYYKESKGQWFLGIYERGVRDASECLETLGIESVMRILYSAFNPVLK